MFSRGTWLHAAFFFLVAVGAAGCANDTRGDAFDGVCLGEPNPGGPFALCGELFNDDGRAFCNAHDGCMWEDCDGTCGFCGGSPNGCRHREDSLGCATEPGCSWFDAPTCATWEDCVIAWLQSGGCEEIATNVPGVIAYSRYVDGVEVEVVFSEHCP